jgi:polyisoprenoid-binding protein YceI
MHRAAPIDAPRHRDSGEALMTRTHIAALALLALIGSAVGAQETARIAVAPGSKLWIEGTSNLHEWSCKADTIDAAIDIDAAAVAQPTAAVPQALKHVQVKVPVRSLKCGHGGMDNNLYKALKADASPNVSYILATFDAAPGATKDSFTLHTSGTLEISGRQNTIALDVVADRLPDGSIKATGTVPIKMTDYGLKPPTALFGRLKTGDDVKVHFELTLSARAIAVASGQR